MGVMILNMSIASLLMCAIVTGMWLLRKKTAFGRLKLIWQRLIIGAVFGLAAILSTHFGINYNSMILNVRDTAPLAAGLLFDPVSGMIAGVIGGIERFIAGQWFAVGSYTRVACGLSTIIAGLLAAAFNKYLFESKKPSPFYAFTTGAIMEVFHMLAILISHMNDIATAFEVVKVCAWPMILFTGLSLSLSTFIVSVLSGSLKARFHRKKNYETPVAKHFQSWLLICVVISFALTFSFTFVVQTNLTTDNAKNVLSINAQDLKKEMSKNESNLEAAKKLLQEKGLVVAHSVANDVSYVGGVEAVNLMKLNELKSQYKLYEINAVNSKGIIELSTNSDYVGFDMNSGAQSREFLVLLDGKTEYAQDFRPITYDSSISIMYIGARTSGGFIQIGYDSTAISNFEKLADVSKIATDRHIGKSGNVYIIEDGKIVSGPNSSVGRTPAQIGVSTEPGNGDYFFGTISGVESFCIYVNVEGGTGLLTMPVSELYQDRDIFAYETAFAEILLFSAIFILIYVLVRRIVVKNLDKVNESLARITGGNLDEIVNVRTSVEFTSLSQDINTTVSTLKQYIKEAENRINAELAFAKSIQHSAIPSVFPPFPDKREFDLFATMETAKEVGGDFYDFFLADENHLALLIADVSDKGIPAALFMMKSKTLIKSLVESGLTPKEAFESANNKLCEGNDAEMFVTAWMGLMDIRTGHMKCVNAGHEYPALKRSGGKYELFTDKHGFVLAGMEGVRYSEYELDLDVGDSIFVYTDGVAEAQTAGGEQFGTERMLEALNISPDASPTETLHTVKRELDAFVNGAAQFDDITMLSLVRKERSADITLNPERNAIARATEFAEGFFENLPPKVAVKMNIVIDEMFSNIVLYSGADFATVTCFEALDRVGIVFRDNGKPYDPLKKEDPDTTLSANEREIGGLGIFMVKKLMDKVEYERSGNENVFRVEKMK